MAVRNGDSEGRGREIFFFLLPIAPVGLRETLDGWPPPVSSAGQIF